MFHSVGPAGKGTLEYLSNFGILLPELRVSAGLLMEEKEKKSANLMEIFLNILKVRIHIFCN